MLSVFTDSGKYEACMECTLMTSIVPHRTTLADLALPVTYILTAFLVSTVQGSCDTFKLMPHVYGRGATVQKVANSSAECEDVCLLDDSCRSVDVIATLCYLHRERVTDAMLVVQHGASHYRRMPRPCGQAAKKKALRKRREPANVVRRNRRQVSTLPPNTTTTITITATERPTTIVRDLAIAIGLSFTLCALATAVQTLHEKYKKRKTALAKAAREKEKQKLLGDELQSKSADDSSLLGMLGVWS